MEWFMARCGIVTASEMSNLVTPLWNIKDGQAVDTYLYHKLAERWTGKPLFTGGSFAMNQGSLREAASLDQYEFDNGVTIDRVGLVTTDDGKIGASPDGIIPAIKTGFEVKNPLRHTHISYLLDGVIPPEYLAQVHGGMLVTGYDAWNFVSACDGFPDLWIPVYRDEKVMVTMRKAIESFNERLDEAYAKLVKINGGEPERISVNADGDTLTMAGVDQNAIDEFYNEETL
jgi:hypothetical protein